LYPHPKSFSQLQNEQRALGSRYGKGLIGAGWTCCTVLAGRKGWETSWVFRPAEEKIGLARLTSG